MLDFIKFSILDNHLIHYLENHNLLEWVKSEDKRNLYDIEVIKTKTVKEFKGIYFCFYSNRIDILFKPHYYFNNNLHNANDFKVNDCINTVLELKEALKIDLKLLKVVNIEFGLNVISPIDIKKLISYLQYHERNEFVNDNKLSYSKKSFKANQNGTANSYKIIKAYAKGIHYPEYSNLNTFRFEIKSKQSKYINQIGIFTGEDLLKIDCYSIMANELINEFDKVLILDCETDFSQLKEVEQSKIKNYLNTMTWFNFKQDSYRNRFNKEKTKYYNLINKVENNLKLQLDKIISEKLEFLKTGAISKHKEKQKTGAISTLKKSNNKKHSKNKTGAISNIYKGGKCTSKEISVIANPVKVIELKSERKNNVIELKKENVIDFLKVRNIENEIPISINEPLSYEQQKKLIEEHNKLAVLNYNNRNKKGVIDLPRYKSNTKTFINYDST